MSWSSYGEFLAFAAVLVLIPGPDFAVVTKNTLMAGRRRGRWTALGICTSNALQGSAAAVGLSTLIVRAQPVFETIKWAGVCYLAYLGAQALRSAIRGHYPPIGDVIADPGRGAALGGWRQGFISNVTNPKCWCSTWRSFPSSSGREQVPVGSWRSPGATPCCRCCTYWP
jgi:threonine/homoserine/homoserine lactone efflux protein